MSQPREPQPAKLVVGFLFRDYAVQQRVLSELCSRFGSMDFLTAPRLFTYTKYYEREMGSGLLRQTGSFLDLVRPENLADIKIFTNSVEREFSVNEQRVVNIDPGILSEERFVLATGKNFTHRIYLRDGIYADLTLIYQKGSYRMLPWTYPDHRDPLLIHFLTALRRKLAFQRSGRLPR